MQPLLTVLGPRCRATVARVSSWALCARHSMMANRLFRTTSIWFKAHAAGRAVMLEVCKVAGGLSLRWNRQPGRLRQKGSRRVWRLRASELAMLLTCTPSQLRVCAPVQGRRSASFHPPLPDNNLISPPQNPNFSEYLHCNAELHHARHAADHHCLPGKPPTITATHRPPPPKHMPTVTEERPPL